MEQQFEQEIDSANTSKVKKAVCIIISCILGFFCSYFFDSTIMAIFVTPSICAVILLMEFLPVVLYVLPNFTLDVFDLYMWWCVFFTSSVLFDRKMVGIVLDLVLKFVGNFQDWILSLFFLVFEISILPRSEAAILLAVMIFSLIIAYGILDISSNTQIIKEKNEYIFVDFNAWEYCESDELWTGLIRNLYEKVELRLSRERYWSGLNFKEVWRIKSAIELLKERYGGKENLRIVCKVLILI